MIPLTPTFLIAAASAFVGLREEGENRGLMIDLMLKGVNLPRGLPWCAAFVHHVGYHAHQDPVSSKSTWPLPPTGSCTLLARFAKGRDILRDEPRDGDVFLIWSDQLVRYAHTGIIVQVFASGRTASGTRWFDCHTIEGNTNNDGGREGWGVLRKQRRFYQSTRDRFIRWVELDERWREGNQVEPPKVA